MSALPSQFQDKLLYLTPLGTKKRDTTPSGPLGIFRQQHDHLGMFTLGPLTKWPDRLPDLVLVGLRTREDLAISLGCWPSHSAAGAMWSSTPWWLKWGGRGGDWLVPLVGFCRGITEPALSILKQSLTSSVITNFPFEKHQLACYWVLF